MLMVVVGHLDFFCLGLSPAAIGHPDYLLNFVGSLQMPLFMFLSGLVIATPPSMGKCWRKVVAYLSPFLIVGSLYALYIGSTSGAFLSDAYKHGYWYLLTLSEFYLLLFTFRWNAMGGGKGLIADVAQFTLISVFISQCGRFLPSSCYDALSLMFCHEHWMWFFGGYLVRKYHLIDKLFLHPWIYSIALVGFVATDILYIGGNGHLFRVVPIMGIIVLMYLFRQREDKTSIGERVLQTIGQHSLDVYIYHYFILRLLCLPAFGLWLCNTHNHLIEIGFCVTVAFIIAYISVFIGYIIRRGDLLSGIIYGTFLTKLLSPEREKQKFGKEK